MSKPVMDEMLKKLESDIGIGRVASGGDDGGGGGHSGGDDGGYSSNLHGGSAGAGGGGTNTGHAVVVVTLPQTDHERLGPLASEAVLKLTNETAASVERTGEELKDKVHELSSAIQKMNEDTMRQLNELDSLMKSALLSISNTVRAVKEDGSVRAKMITEVAESLRRVDQQCQTMRREFARGEVQAS